ncbi:MAG: hypothetical protein ACI9FG_002054 [Crocinitomicaceae bacterium]|jgi:molecular chaperone DnaK (HSP70)
MCVEPADPDKADGEDLTGLIFTNFKDDIGEAQNLVKSNPKVFAQMRQELEACYKRFGATSTLAANPEYKSKEAEAERAKLTPETLPAVVTSAQAYKLLR